jgi:hypothetical protein
MLSQQGQSFLAYAKKILWWLVIIGMAASIPIIYERWVSERSANNVELVFDYMDLLTIAEFQEDPQAFVNDELKKLKEAGIHSMAVYESTLREWRLKRKIHVYSAKEAAELTQDPHLHRTNHTYVLFLDKSAQSVLEPIIRQAFEDRDSVVEAWSHDGLTGLRIAEPIDTAYSIPMLPDPITMRTLHEAGFGIVVRLSDNRKFDQERLEALLAEMQQYDVERIVFSGSAVTGFEDDPKKHTMSAFARLLDKYDMGITVIELLNKQQKGMEKLAYLTDYNVVRLHSILEGETIQDPGVLADRIVLAVKDRNIRMIYLNATVTKDPEKILLKNTLDNLYKVLKGPEGAIHRLQNLGFNIGTAEPFQNPDMPFDRILKVFVLLGAVALIALAMSQFYAWALLPLFVLGLAGTGLLYMVSTTLLSQALALGAAIFAPTLAVIMAIKRLKQRNSLDKPSKDAGCAVCLFAATTALSLIGAVYVVSLLDHITYMLVLQQFRGVSLLHLAPVALVGVYLVSIAQIMRFLNANIKVFWVVIAGVGLAGVWYYLSRTGNQGQISAYEKMFRALLEDTLGVRPRTKEILAHIVFIIGAYAALKYKQVLYVMIFAVIGQLSIVDTFAHIHTPILISAIRVLYGAIFGAIIGLMLIAVWEIALRSWKKWALK